jgi:hypothetical protein
MQEMIPHNTITCLTTLTSCLKNQHHPCCKSQATTIEFQEPIHIQHFLHDY